MTYSYTSTGLANEQVVSSFTYIGSGNWSASSGGSAVQSGQHITNDTLAIYYHFDPSAIDPGTGTTYQAAEQAWDAANPGAAQANNANNGGGQGTSASDILDFGFGIGNLVVNGVSLLAIGTILLIIYGFVSTVMVIAGAILDLTLHATLFNMSNFFSSLGTLTNVWTIMRDAANITFIFILLFIAITMIVKGLGLQSKATITGVIVSAIFINFSLFFTELMIDAGNIIAVAIFNKIPNITFYGSTVTNSATNIGSSISGLLINSFTNSNHSLLSLATVSGQAGVITNLVLHIILVAIVCWALFYAGAMFTGRLVILIILAVTSPFGFIGGALPWLDSVRKDWWGMLTEQILVAPLFMVVILILVTFLQSLGGALQSATVSSLWNNFTSTNGSSGFDWQSYLYFAITIFFFWKGMQLVRKWSGEVGKVAMAVMNTVTIAGLTAITGGLAGGGMLTGMFGAEAAGAAEAAAAGKRGVSAITARMGARLNAGLKAENFGTNAGKTAYKFATGGFNEKPGVLGDIGRTVRKTAFSEITKATGGLVNPAKIETAIKKRSAENEKLVMKEKESVGGQKQIDEQKQLSEIEKNINAQVDQRLAIEDPTLKSKLEHIENDKANAEKEINKKQEELNKTNETLKKAQDNLDRMNVYVPAADRAQATKAVEEARTSQVKAQESLNETNKKLGEIKELMGKREAVADKVAGELGVNWTEMKERQETLNKTIAEKAVEANKFIRRTAEAGPVAGFFNTGILFTKERQKVVQKMRAQKGKYNNIDFKKAIADLQKNLGVSEEGGGDKPKEQKKEEK
ncbi:MAG: hypothetical protein KGH93_00915 [Patescibacteria group bacterium]|nr:hypothetical protein [Patescibacteria group bacterium]MDE1945741.1 hypothetical protein [Patescibacteria group bacterium]